MKITPKFSIYLKTSKDKGTKTSYKPSILARKIAREKIYGPENHEKILVNHLFNFKEEINLNDSWRYLKNIEVKKVFK